MTTGVCSKTVARGRKIRANPPCSALPLSLVLHLLLLLSPCVCLPSPVPFARGRNESKWRHRTLTTLDPLSDGRAGALVAESRDERARERGDPLASVTLQSERTSRTHTAFLRRPFGSTLFHGSCKTAAFGRILLFFFLSNGRGHFFPFNLARGKLDANSAALSGRSPEFLFTMKHREAFHSRWS